MDLKLYLVLTLALVFQNEKKKLHAAKFTPEDALKYVQKAGCVGKYVEIECKNVEPGTPVVKRWHVVRTWLDLFGPKIEYCKVWDKQDVNLGKLLAEGACTVYGYQPALPPGRGKTNVHCKVSQQKVRAVNDKQKTITVDFTLSMSWEDDGIKTKFSDIDRQYGGIEIGSDKAKGMWLPQLYVYDISDYKSLMDSMQTSQMMITSENPLGGNTTTVKWQKEGQATVYCNFDHSAYPMDKQTCKLRIGSQSMMVNFVLFDKNIKGDDIYNGDDVGFDITIEYFEGNLTKSNITESTIGMEFKMERILYPFVMKYYLPCIAIVVISQISYIIPLTAIPGRVALLVTQFLTLTNLFIYQMVKLHCIFV